MRILFATLASALFVTPTLFAQGVLAPTAAPGPLMKSLDQIEPRIPINSLPYTIATSGSYYFTKNLQFTATSGNAITISVDDVTLDLGGFTLSSTAAVTGRAISIGSVRGVTVKNGDIAGNTTVVISGTAPNQTWTPTPGGFDYGIYDFASGTRYQELGIRGCRNHGLYVIYGHITSIDKVSASSNGGYGISANVSSISNCTAYTNGGIGISSSYGSITNSTATSNGSYGIHASSGSAANVSASYNGDTGIYAASGSIINASARINSSNGIHASNGSVTNSTSTDNSGIGINALYSSVTNSVATNNDEAGISATGGSVINSTATSNSGTGIMATSGSVTSSTARSNAFYGIYAPSGSVTSSTALSNTGTDLYATNAVVAFCKAGTKDVTGSTLTGNLTNP